MCRLLVLTPTPKFDPNFRATFFNMAMLAATLDDNQTDGAGIWDGRRVTKVEASYRDMSPTYILHLDDKVVWLGHVRKRSPGTSSDVLAAHPYEFIPVPGKGKLIMAHNGYIRGTVPQADDAANTDSYRAARVLANMIAAGSPLNKNTIETWISGFGYGSEWSITLTYEGVTYIVRGQRTIFATELGDDGDGVLFNTSEAVVVYMRNYLRMLNPKIKLSPTRSIQHHHLVTIKPDGSMSMEPYRFQSPAAPESAPFLWTSSPDGDVRTVA